MSWKIEEGVLVKEFTLRNFLEAVSFVEKIAALAESANHHPDLLIHSYKYVKVMLITHDTSSITKMDYSLSDQIDGLFATTFK